MAKIHIFLIFDVITIFDQIFSHSSVCLSVCEKDISKSYGQIVIQF